LRFRLPIIEHIGIENVASTSITGVLFFILLFFLLFLVFFFQLQSVCQCLLFLFFGLIGSGQNLIIQGSQYHLGKLGLRLDA
jgi:hypothetical protein